MSSCWAMLGGSEDMGQCCWGPAPAYRARGLGRSVLGLAMPREGELTTSFILTQDILTE